MAQLDVIRGLALFGVLIVNLETVFRIPLLEHILDLDRLPMSASDHAIDFVVARGLEFKAFTIFSLLFGAGIANQAGRGGGRAVGFLARRLGWLLLLGLSHLLLLWNGDILVLYSLSGLLLLPALRLPWPALLGIGSVLLTLADAATYRLPLPQREAADALIEEARMTYANGGLGEIVRFRWRETHLLMAPLLAGVMPRTAGMMFWGMAGWQSGILREPRLHRGKLLGVLTLGLPIGTWKPSWPAWLAFAYLAGLLLFLTPNRCLSLPGLAAAGRMSLTNYLTQSIVLGVIFYGYGLGLFGRLGQAVTFCIGAALFFAQVLFSRIWLARYPFGPVEWLWRSLSYGRKRVVT